MFFSSHQFQSRFLLTTNSALPLKKYDPFKTASGPWRIQKGGHYAQKEYDNYRLDLEFMLGNQI